MVTKSYNKADKADANEAIGIGVERADEILNNQIAELKKLDVANKAIVSNRAGELSELALTDKAVV